MTSDERSELLGLLAGAKDGLLSLEVRFECYGLPYEHRSWGLIGKALEELEEVILTDE